MTEPSANTSGDPHAPKEPDAALSPSELPASVYDEALGRHISPESRSRTESAAVNLGTALGDVAGKFANRSRRGLHIVSDRSKEMRAKLDEYADVARERARELGREAGRRLHDLRSDTERISRERPLEALLAVAGAAFVVGFLLRLWRSHRD